MNNLTISNSKIQTKKNLNQKLYLYFKLGQSSYAINVENVLEVMKLPHLNYPQKLPNNIIGFLNYNETTIKILDVRMYLNLEVTPYNISNKLIIVNFEGLIIGFIVDEINDIISVTEAELEEYTSDNTLIRYIFYVENKSVSVIDLTKIKYLLKTGCKDANINIEKLFPNDKKSKEILAQRSNNLTIRPKLYLSENYSQNKYISFMLNKNKYCIKLSYIKEVSQKMNIINVPCAPEYIEGLTTLRGDFITIINLKKFLNLSQSEYSKQSKIIIIDAENYKLGFLADKIFELTDISENSIKKSKVHENPYILAELILNDDLYQILNMEKILTDEKMFINEE